jgi:hypothetical protein
MFLLNASVENKYKITISANTGSAFLTQNIGLCCSVVDPDQVSSETYRGSGYGKIIWIWIRAAPDPK